MQGLFDSPWSLQNPMTITVSDYLIKIPIVSNIDHRIGLSAWQTERVTGISR